MSEKVEPKEKMIFAVDDDSVFLNSCVDFFNREGFRTGSAVDGEEALKKIARNQYQFLLLQ